MNFKEKIYKFNDSWRLAYFADGKRVRKKFKYKRDAKLWLDEFKINYNSGCKLTLGDHANAYLKVYPESNLVKTKWIYDEFINELGSFKPYEISSKMLQDWLYNIKGEHNLRLKSVSNYKSNLNVLFKYLVSVGILVINPIDQISLAYKTEPKKEKYSDEFMEKLYYYSPYLLWRIIWLEKNAGLTRKEVLNLKWSDDLDKFDIAVRFFIENLPRRSDYIIANRKGRKVDRNLVSRGVRVFKERQTCLLFPSQGI